MGDIRDEPPKKNSVFFGFCAGSENLADPVSEWRIDDLDKLEDIEIL